MCICFFLVGTPNSSYPLIFCGNRDEFYTRDSITFQEWKDAPGIFGGRDAVRGGTWLGVKPAHDGHFKFAVVHNFRHNSTADPSKLSRGDLPMNFLKGTVSAADYAAKVAAEGNNYMGFTLILADKSGVYFTSNRGPPRKLKEGIYALCNSLLDTPWPKLLAGKERFRHVIDEFHPKKPWSVEEEDELMSQLLTQVLRDNTIYPYPLPGILDPHTEILLSSVFIEPYKWKEFGFYGTRMHTLFVIRKDGTARFQEHTIDTSTAIRDWKGTWSSVAYESRNLQSKL